MTQKSICGLHLQDIFAEVLPLNPNFTSQLCQEVWDSFVKAIIQTTDSNKSCLISDMFYIVRSQIKNIIFYKWIPTNTLLAKCDLTSNEENEHMGMISIITKQKMNKYFTQDQNTHGLVQLKWKILMTIFECLRSLITAKEFLDLDIGFFGIIRVKSGLLEHMIKDDRNIRIKKLVTPRRNNSIRISKKAQLLRQSSETSELRQSLMRSSSLKKQFFGTPLLGTKCLNNHNLNLANTDKKANIQRSFMNNLSSPDARISNDLLGAGIDPLKFDYNYSNLVNQTQTLFNKTFTKPKPAKIRHPGIIDKFQRTTGVPQTGLKVGNSVIVRIGSNYNPYAKNIYVDINSKRIEFVPRQPKITFEGKKVIKQIFACATQEDEYNFICGGQTDENLRKKVKERYGNYQRYTKYIQKYIDNSNVCPIPEHSLKMILQRVKNSVRNIKDPESIAIMDQVINDANKEYYYAYKKSMLDYILKDQKQRQRTGIHMIFRPAHQWGQSRKSGFSSQAKRKLDRNANNNESCKNLKQLLFHPECVTQIQNFNLKLKDLDLFRIKNQDGKPINVLYFVKKQTTHIADVMAYLSSDWIKKVSQIVQKHIKLDKQPEEKVTTFLRLINVILSNALNNLVDQSLRKLLTFFNKFSKKSTSYQHPMLQISMSHEGQKFSLSDDFRKTLNQEMCKLIFYIISESKKIHGIQFYLKDESGSFLWNQDKNDGVYNEVITKILAIIEENCLQIDEFKQQFEKYQVILRCQQQITQWLKKPRSLEQISSKQSQIKQMQELISTIPFCFVNKMVLIQCFDLKQKLRSSLSTLKGQINSNLRISIQKSNYKSFVEIQEIKRSISSPIENSFDYMKVAQDLEDVKKRKLSELLIQLQYNRRCLSKLLEMSFGTISPESMEKIYMTNKMVRNLNSKISYHEDRLCRQKVQLQVKLKQKIKQFEQNTQVQLVSISAKIDEFEIRKIYSQYLKDMNQFKAIVEENNSIMADLHMQQENLKWTKTTFKAAEELKNIVMPNFQLWNMVSEYQCIMKQWKNKEICQMDAGMVRRRIEEIYSKVTKLINKLKNLSSLKVVHEVQKDTKDILTQYVQIIEIFSHPGLKQRHWQLFNSKLMIPGVDLKQITYSKIKTFDDYEKNLKILSVISTQAAKQFEIQKERNEQQQYWMGISFQTYSSSTQGNFCISQTFLTNCLGQMQVHTNKLAVMKNYLYSKALYQQLQQWQIWLAASRKNIENLKKVQSQLSILRPLFCYQQISKQLPIENSQFESIDSYWKTLTKKIWQHSKLYQFMKSPKVSQMIEELLKKIQVLKRSIPIFLLSKRSEYPRFYFIPDSKFTNILIKAIYQATQRQAIQEAFEACFAENLTLNHNEERFISVKSQTDVINLTSDVFQIKTKKKVCDNLTLLEKSIRYSVRSEILKLLNCDLNNNYASVVDNFSLTSIFCTSNINMTIELQQNVKQNSFGSLMREKEQAIKKLSGQIRKSNKAQQAQKLRILEIKKRLIKMQKIILSLIGETEKISQLMHVENVNLNSFQYLCIPKFIITNQQTCQDEPKQQQSGNRALTPAQRIENAYKMINKLRKSQNTSNLMLNSSKISIKLMERSIEYKEQFWGDEVHNFLPAFTNKTIFCLLTTVMQNRMCGLTFERASALMRKLAIICGQKIFEIEDKYFGDDEGIKCLMHGIASGRAWMFANHEKLKWNYKIFDKVNELICELREKKQQDLIENKIFQESEHYLKSLSQVCQISYGFGCFFNFGKVAKYQQIPKSFKTQMRSINLCYPPFQQFLQSQLTKNQVLLENEKQNHSKSSIFELTSLFQQPQRCKQNICQLIKFEKQCLEVEDTKIKSELLDYLILDKFKNQKNNRQLTNQLHQILDPVSYSVIEQKLKSKQSGTHHASIMMTQNQFKQKQKTTYNELIDKFKGELIQYLNDKHRNIIVLQGPFDVKTKIVCQAIKESPIFSKIQRTLYSFPIFVLDSGVRNFFESTVSSVVSQINKIVQTKAGKKFINSNRRQIYLHFQYAQELQQQKISELIQLAKQYQKSVYCSGDNLNTYELSIKIIIDCTDLNQLSPSSCINISKINVDFHDNFNFSQYYCQWLTNNLSSDKSLQQDNAIKMQTVTHSLIALEPTLMSLLNAVLRTRSTRPQTTTKFCLIVHFLEMLKIYIDHLKTRQVGGQYDDFDVNSYIINSFVYCAYWTFCIGFLPYHEHFNIQQMLTKQLFNDIGIQGIADYMLNQENQWLQWKGMREQFALAEAKNVPIYSVWVSTEQNMKMYTNIIKMLEKGMRITVDGQKCSGKSTLLKEISNFEMSYNSFLVDCHKLTRVDQVSEVVKNRIFYTKFDKMLILVDDLNLPIEQVKIVQVLKKALEENILTCNFGYSKFLQNKKLQSTLSVILAYSNEEYKGTKSEITMLEMNTQKFHLRQYQQAEISTIFSAYLTFELQRLKLKLCDKLNDFSPIFTGFISRIAKKFSVQFHTLSKIFRLFITKINSLIGKDKKEDQELQVELKKQLTLLELVKLINICIFKLLGSRSNFDSIVTICLEQTNKALNANQFKHYQQFYNKINQQKFKLIPFNVGQTKTSSKPTSGPIVGEKSVRQLAETVSNIIEELSNEKCEGINYIPSSFHTDLIIKMYSILKICPSHIILLSETSSQKIDNDSCHLEAGSCGLRTMTKLVSLLLSINHYEIDNENVLNFAADSLNIIKAGGKIDESVYYLSKTQFKNILSSNSKAKEIVPTINAFISSPQIWEVFDEEKIEQIFVKFCSQKKNFKRNEFIKKVRQKINFLFHFIISLDNDSYQYMSKNYPGIFKQSYVIAIHKLPEEALYQIATRSLKSVSKINNDPSISSIASICTIGGCLEQQKYRKSTINCLMQIHNKFENLLKLRFKEAHPDYTVKYPIKNIYQYFQVFKSLKKKFEELTKKEEVNGDSWMARRKETQAKYDSLMVEKNRLMKLHEQYSAKQQQINNQISQIRSSNQHLLSQIENLQNNLSVQTQELSNLQQQKSKINQSLLFQLMVGVQQNIGSLTISDFQGISQNQNLNNIILIFLPDLPQIQVDNVRQMLLKSMEAARKFEIPLSFANDTLKQQEEDPKLMQQLRQWSKHYIELSQKRLKCQELVEDQHTRITATNNMLISLTRKKQQTEQQIQKLQQKLSVDLKQAPKISAQFEQLCKSVQHLQPILNIFKHFENVIKVSNKKKEKQKIYQSPSNIASKTIGSLVMATSYISLGFYIADSDSDKFWTDAKQCVRANGLELDQKCIFDSILNQEEKFKNRYGFMNNNDWQTVCQIGLNCNNCSVLRLNDDELVNLYEWLVQTTERTVKIIENNELSQVSECVSNGSIGLIINPSHQMLRKLKPLIKNQVQLRNNTMFINLTQQIVFNTASKIIFIVTHSYLKEGKLQNSGLSNLWHVRFPSLGLSETLKINSIDCLLPEGNSSRSQLIQEHLQLFQQLSKIDKKIEKLILTIRKNVQNPDRIIIKMEAISQDKQKVMSRMEEIVQKLDQIENRNGVDLADQDSKCGQIYRMLQQFGCWQYLKGREIYRFNRLLGYLKQATKEQTDISLLREKVQAYANLFVFSNRSLEAKKEEVEDVGKFKKIQRELNFTQKIELIMNKNSTNFTKLQQRSNDWMIYLKTILTLNKRDQQRSVGNLSMSKKLTNEATGARESILKDPVKEKQQVGKQNKNILVYHTENMDLISRFFVTMLTENRIEAVVKDVAVCAEYNPKNLITKNLITIVQIRSSKDWKFIAQYINSQDQRPSKQSNIKLLILCQNSMQIPAHIQARVLIAECTDQSAELYQAMVGKQQELSILRISKIKQLEQQLNKRRQKMERGHENDRSWQRAVEKRRVNINKQQLIEEIYYINELNMQNSQKSKYLDMLFL